ncbi:hypothetical protein GCM10023195_64890 [Actinoallomurus liliacearum]|uniref:Uncharacterized protein n=1 Tax=Actinoallomurus liliacearum TaxID=1080073 RepID=A0ABP8TRN1_9ACTN
MPFGGAFVMDDARLAARQIGSELAALLAGTAAAPAGPDGGDTSPSEPAGSEPGAAGTPGVSPALAPELRLGVEEGWLIHQEETA